ncbi:MAG: condensation domain-containing protein, partial [Gammaproteobacteria bacterium]
MKAGIIEDVYPLSPLQEGMLFHHLYAPNSGVDIEQIICTLQEDLQVPVFNQAWQLVTDDHPILRSRFRWEGLDKPVQEVYDRVTLPIQQKDWRDYSEHEQHLSLQAYLNDDRSRDFDLTQAPLMRLALFRTGAADYRLVWSFQHVLLDGRSFPLVLKRVFNLYEALRQGRDIQLSPTRPYRDYINWLYAQDWSKAQEFWRAKLKGYTSPVLLKVAIATPPATQEGYGRQQSALSADLTNTLRSQAERHKVTLNTFMQGAWALLLSRYSGQADVVFGATRACRRSALDGAEDMVGLLINTLPVRVQTFSETQLLPWLQALRAQQIEVRQYEHTPLARVQGWSDLPPGTPLFESLLVFENYQLNALLRAQGGDWLHREFHYIGQTNFPLTVLCYAEQELLIQIEYDRSCFEDAAITRMLGHLETLLDGMAADPYRQLSDYPLLTPAELRQLLFEWNAVRTDYSRNICLHELFEARAATLPDQTAVVFEGEALSYGELNRRANRLANYLHTLGVGPEIRVGLYLERSLEMLIGLLAILKAGGAYVPLDPSYPAERINFMLEDAQVPVLIAERRLLDGLNAGRAKLLCLDTDGDEIEQCQDHNPQC